MLKWRAVIKFGIHFPVCQFIANILQTKMSSRLLNYHVLCPSEMNQVSVSGTTETPSMDCRQNLTQHNSGFLLIGPVSRCLVQLFLSVLCVTAILSKYLAVVYLVLCWGWLFIVQLCFATPGLLCSISRYHPANQHHCCVSTIIIDIRQVLYQCF